MRAEELLTRWTEIKGDVGSLEEAAERLGMTRYALEKALERARARGDERGVYAPMRVLRPRLEERRARRYEIAKLYADLPADQRRTHVQAAAILGVSTSVLASTLWRVRHETEDRAHAEALPGIDREAILEDWEMLRDGGEDWERAAARIGIPNGTMHRVLLDARAEGDERGHLTIEDLLEHRRNARRAG